MKSINVLTKKIKIDKLNIKSYNEENNLNSNDDIQFKIGIINTTIVVIF